MLLNFKKKKMKKLDDKQNRESDVSDNSNHFIQEMNSVARYSFYEVNSNLEIQILITLTGWPTNIAIPLPMI